MLSDVLNETGMVQAEVNNLVYTVTDGNADVSNDFQDYALTIQVGMMPVHTTEFYGSVSEIEEKYPDLVWESIEPEEI